MLDYLVAFPYLAFFFVLSEPDILVEVVRDGEGFLDEVTLSL